jgi:hypothetical protein
MELEEEERTVFFEEKWSFELSGTIWSNEERNPKHVEHQERNSKTLKRIWGKREREREIFYLRNETVIWAETVRIKWREREREREFVMHAHRLLKTELSFLVKPIYVIVLVVCL